METETNSVELAYDVYEPSVDSGKPPIIVLHGLFMNRKLMAEVSDRLCKKTNRKVYTLDLRGHGESPKPPDLSVYAFAADVERFIRFKSLKKVTFVCNSFATRIAAVIVDNQPELVEKLVLIEISPFTKDDGKRFEKATQFFEQATLFLKRMGKSMSLDVALELGMSFMTDEVMEGGGYGKLLKHTMIKDEKGVRPEWDIEAIRKNFAVGNLSINSPTNVFTGPALFVVGDRSRSFLRDDDDPRLWTYYPNLKTATIEGGTHMLVMEKPEAFVDTVQEFILSG